MANHWGGDNRKEKNSGIPVEIPVGACIPEPLEHMIARMLRQELQNERQDSFETMEEADDFEPENEEQLPFSRYELEDAVEEFLTQPPPHALTERLPDEKAKEVPTAPPQQISQQTESDERTDEAG